MTVPNCGREVTIERPPARVLTIGAEAPVLVAAAGGADRVVGRAGEYGSPLGRYGGELRDVPQLTTGQDDPSLESVLASRPDLVITRGSEDIAAGLDAAGIGRLVISGRCTSADGVVTADGTFEEIYRDVERYGRLFGAEGTAAAAVRDLRDRVDAVQARFRDRPQPRAAAVIEAEGGLGSYGRRSIAHHQMQALGLRNVFAEVPERFFEPGVEEIIARDPQVLLVFFDNLGETAESTRAALRSDPRLANVSAIRTGDILVIPFALSASSPLAVTGLEMLAQQREAVR